MLGLLKEEALDLNRDGGWDDPGITLNKVHHPTVLEKWRGVDHWAMGSWSIQLAN